MTASKSTSNVAASVLLVSHVNLRSFGPDATELRGLLFHMRASSVVHPTYATFLIPARTDWSCLHTLINGCHHVLHLTVCLKWTCNHLLRSSNGLIISSRRSSRCIGICSGYHVQASFNNWNYIDTVQDVEGQEHTEGFWRELFLLKPDLARLKQILEDIDAEYLLHAPVCVGSHAFTVNRF